MRRSSLSCHLWARTVILERASRRDPRIHAWIVVGAVVLSAGLYQALANLVIRNAALLFAALDAAVAMVFLLRSPLQQRCDDATQ